MSSNLGHREIASPELFGGVAMSTGYPLGVWVPALNAATIAQKLVPSQALPLTSSCPPKPSELIPEDRLHFQRSKLQDAEFDGNKTTNYPHPFDAADTSLVAMIQGVLAGCTRSQQLQSQKQHEGDCPNLQNLANLQRDNCRHQYHESTNHGLLNTHVDRTKGIPIKKLNPEQIATSSNADPAPSVHAYDWATWRMYHRIVDHRAKYPANSYYLATDVDVVYSRTPLLPESQIISDACVSDEEMLMEGEIFQLEM